MRKTMSGVVCGVLMALLTACDGGGAVPFGGSGGEVSAGSDVRGTGWTDTGILPGNPSDVPDPDWSGVATTSILLEGTSIVVEGSGASAEGSVVTITAAGTYRLSGALADGQIRVETTDSDEVALVFEGVDVACSTSAALYVVEAEDVTVFLAAGTTNRLADGTAYVLADEAVNEPNAALFSMGDLTITGNGALTVEGRYNDGIASKDSLHVEGGTIVVTAVDDGLRGKDELVIEGGSVTVSAGGDGLTSDNAEEAERGFVALEGGTLDITSGGDGISAETTVTVSGGSATIVAGGGSSRAVAESESAKGVKGLVGVTIVGGRLAIDAADDGVHSNGSILVEGGSLLVASADDGLHADTSLTVSDGVLDVTRSYEGIESTAITIDGGTLHLVASDDGINVAGGADGSGMGGGDWPGGTGTTTDTSGYLLTIRGGYVAVDADGDGLDSNGSIAMSGGVVLVNGPTNNGNGACDIGERGATFVMTGGFLVATGSSGMAIAPDTTSTQYSVLVNFTSQQAGQIVHLEDSAGASIVTFEPTKTYQSILVSSPDLGPGSYGVYFGGSSSGALVDSLYEGGAYTAGTKYTTFTVSSVTTQVGGGGGHGGPW